MDTYAICVIDAPEDMKAVMSPAHNDHAQIWINGEKWYNNSAWTGAAQQVDFNVEVQLQKGANVLLVLHTCSIFHRHFIFLLMGQTRGSQTKCLFSLTKTQFTQCSYVNYQHILIFIYSRYINSWLASVLNLANQLLYM